MQFKATFEKPRLDLAAWRRQMAVEMETTLEIALVAWLSAATAPIPTWSGASLGTFSELAARVNFQLRISPTALGSKLGQGPDAGAAASKGTIDIDKRNGLFKAEYSTSLEHLIYNEFNNANAGGDPRVFARLKNPGPYGFLEKGASAFERAAQRGSLPDKVPLKVKKREVR